MKGIGRKELEDLRRWAVHGNWKKWGPLITVLEALDDHIDALESDRDNLMKRMSHQECPSPLMLDLVKRVCALDDGSDYEVHNVCEECADNPCDHRPREWLIPQGKITPFECYRKTPTCGECSHPWRKHDHEDFPCFDHPSLAIGNYEKPSWRLPHSEACPAFDAIEEAT